MPYFRSSLTRAVGVAVFRTLPLDESANGFEFVPLRDTNGKVPAIFESALGPLGKILAGYIDRHGKPLENCVVATTPGRGWDSAKLWLIGPAGPHANGRVHCPSNSSPLDLP